MREIKIDRFSEGGRLDKAVLKYLDLSGTGFVYKMLRKKNIVLNDKKASGNEILKDGDIIRLYLADETIRKFRSRDFEGSSGHCPEFEKLILFEDENILVFQKPAGMLSQKGSGNEKSADDLLKAYLGKGELFTPGLSNRLDRNTSGLMAAGKNPAAVRLLNESIKNRNIRKEYLCLVVGKPQEKALLTGYLKKNEKTNQTAFYECLPDDIPEKESARFIQTAYQRISAGKTVSLLLVDLITGRSHQIRAHFAALGFPILGDPKYGISAQKQELIKKYQIHRQLLHSFRMRFSGMEGILSGLNGLCVTAPLPDDLMRTIKGEQLCLPGDPEALEAPSLKF